MATNKELAGKGLQIMKLIMINDNPMDQNIYLYFDEKTNEGVIIDPGSSRVSSIEKIINDNNIKLEAILLTHSHYDHIGAVQEIKSLTGATIYCHEAEKPLLEDPKLNLSKYSSEIEFSPDKVFADGEVYTIANTKIKVLHTPGHTQGCCCFYDAKNANLFSGDTLFRETVGRTDLPTSDTSSLLEGIKEKLFSLPDDTKVYPGHGLSSTIGHEKRFNPLF